MLDESIKLPSEEDNNLTSQNSENKKATNLTQEEITSVNEVIDEGEKEELSKEEESNLTSQISESSDVKESDTLATEEVPSPNTTVDEIEIITTLPDNPLLDQNYPNPFNPGTTIRYHIRKPSIVNITIYNLLGQTVKTLVDDFRPVGNYEIYWDGTTTNGSRVASGIYFYHLSTDKNSESRKMFLIR